MNDRILTWNLTNWITVVLMAAIAYFAIGAGTKWWQGRQAA